MEVSKDKITQLYSKYPQYRLYKTDEFLKVMVEKGELTPEEAELLKQPSLFKFDLSDNCGLKLEYICPKKYHQDFPDIEVDSKGYVKTKEKITDNFLDTNIGKQVYINKKDDTGTRQDNEDGTYSISITEDVYEKVNMSSMQKAIKNYVLHNKQVGRSISNVFEDIVEKIKNVIKTKKIKTGTVYRTTNYSADNKIQSIETTKGDMTTVTDAAGNILKTIRKNEGHSDTICEYNYLDDNKKEECVYYGENGIKNSNIPQYKNVYQNNQLIERYEYDSEGNIIQKQNYSGGNVSSVTKYVNGLEGQTVNIHTNGIYNLADAVADGIIDPTRQHGTGDCYLLNALQNLQQESWGRDGLNKCIKRDVPNIGDYTIIFQKAYGEQKEFVITKSDIEKAEQEKVGYYNFNVEKGDKIYIDGKLEITITDQESFMFNKDDVKKDITFVSAKGKNDVWTVEKLTNYAKDGYIELPKYSSGDKDTLAFELAYERNRAQAGITLEGGGYEDVIVCVMGDYMQYEVFENTSLCKDTSESASKTSTEKEKDKQLNEARTNILENCSVKYNDNLDTKSMKEKLLYLKNNFDKFSNEVWVMGGVHSGRIRHFEEENGEIYVIYSHATNSAAEIRENINDFVKQLGGMTIVTKAENTEPNANSDGKYGNYKSSEKRNLSNVTASLNAYMNAYGEDAINNMITKDRQGNITITFPNEKPIKISQKDVVSATATGNYALDDDDITAIEVAMERILNNKLHNNTVDELEHTDLSEFSLEDVFSLLGGKKVLDGYINEDSVDSIINDDKMLIMYNSENRQYISIKEIKEMPNGAFRIVATSSEDSNTDVILYKTRTEIVDMRILRMFEQ